MSIETGFVPQNSSPDAKRDEAFASFGQTLSPEAWQLLASLATVPQEKFAETVEQFNALGAKQLAENMPSPDESLAEREQKDVRIDLPNGRSVISNRSMRGIFTLRIPG